MVNKTGKSVEYSLRTIKICRFEIIDGVKYVYSIKHAYKFVLREQVGFAAVLCVFLVYNDASSASCRNKHVVFGKDENEVTLNATPASSFHIFLKRGGGGVCPLLLRL